MDVITNILKMMERNGVTAAQLTREIGLTNGLITQWKQGKQKPSMEKVKMIAEYFNVTTDYLLGNEQKNSPLPEMSSEQLDMFNKIKSLPLEKQKIIRDLIHSLEEN